MTCGGITIPNWKSTTMGRLVAARVRNACSSDASPKVRSSPGKRGAFNRSMQHHLGTNLFKGGVYDPTKTVETFSRGKDRHLAPMEVRAVPARDWARFWQATSHHSQDIVAMLRYISPPFCPLACVV